MIEKENSIKKHNIFILAIVLTIITIIGLGTYALLVWTSEENTELTVRIGSVAGCYFETGSNINVSNLGPIFDYEKDGESTTFTITNYTNEIINDATANFKVTSLTDNLKEESFKWVVMSSTDGQNFTKINEGNFSSVASGSTIGLFSNGSIQTNSSVIYKLIFYIDGNQENPISMQGGSLNGYISAGSCGSGIDSSGAASPELTDGLIPVYWNDAGNLLKADSTNSGGNWYNYSEKRWANAVLVDQSSRQSISYGKTVDLEISNIFDGVLRATEDGQYQTITFTTGASGGTLVLYYIIESDDGSATGELGISLNSEPLAMASPDDDSDVSVELAPNTNYTLSFGLYLVDTSINTYANISFGSYPSDISNISTSGNFGIDAYFYNVASSISIIDNAYVLTSFEKKYGTDAIGNYICSDGVSATCETMYKIQTINGSKVIGADEYTIISDESYANAAVDTVIAQEDVLAYYTWIPRYKYKVLTSGAATADTMTPETIDIVFEPSPVSSDYSMADGTLVGSYRTHPAFWWDDNSDGTVNSGEIISGFWVGKFETGGEQENPLIIPDTVSLTDLTVAEHFATSQLFGTPTYGLSSSIVDAHMLKNSEWGAVAYLSHSQYGVNREVYINNSSSHYTGRSGGNIGGSTPINGVYTSQTSTTQYNTYGFYTWDGYLLEYGTNTKSSTRDLTKVASTTGNITGVYDMAGGRTEYVMGYYKADETTVWGADYTDLNYAGFDSEPASKYYDNYTSRERATACNGGICYGHALSETNNWYSDYNYFISGASPWFSRGGGASDDGAAGIFAFEYFSGNSGSLGARSVLVIK